MLRILAAVAVVMGTLMSSAATTPWGLADAAGTYAIRQDGSAIRFSIANAGGGDLKAAFARFQGSIRIDAAEIGHSAVDITIFPDSVSSGQPRIDAFLKSDAVFDVANDGSIHFRSTAVRRTGAQSAEITGLLTARGKTVTERFAADLTRLKGGAIVFHVTGKVLRSRYGMDVGTPIYSNVVDFDMTLAGRRG